MSYEINLCITYIKKGGGYPHHGGGLQTLYFKGKDSIFIAKILNELDMSDKTYHYAITTSATIRDFADYDLVNIKRDILTKSLYQDLKKLPINKSLTYANGWIYINYKGVNNE
jgi:hypothetical protein